MSEVVEGIAPPMSKIPGWNEYVEWSRAHRDYTGDPTATEPHAFLRSLGVDTVPHATNAPVRLEDMTPETLLAEGSFFDHLAGNESVVRAWQEVEPELYSDAVAHAALFHSIYVRKIVILSRFVCCPSR